MKLDDFFEKSFLRNKIYRKKDIGLTIPMVASSVVRPGNEQPRQTVTQNELVEKITEAIRPQVDNIISQLKDALDTTIQNLSDLDRRISALETGQTVDKMFSARISNGNGQHATIGEFFNNGKVK